MRREISGCAYGALGAARQGDIAAHQRRNSKKKSVIMKDVDTRGKD
jgi:hypothetical protein